MSSVLHYIQKRELGSRLREEKIFIREKLATDEQLYKKDLLAHFGCVNAVEFSGDGSLLVSGGDDRRVLLWQLDQAITDNGKYSPVAMEAEHRSNIFCLGFDSGNTRLYSGGNDEQVIVHDMTTRQPLDYFPHEEPVYGLSVHPTNHNLFLTACSDGRVLLYDLRQRVGEDPVMLAGFSHAFHAVAFNPMEPRLVVTANQKHGIGLWDIRKPERVVLEYGSMGGRQQTSMYVRWNMTGDRILGLRRRLPPVMYRIEKPGAVAQFDHPGYYNSCTMKSCCFGGPDDEYVLSGSDDFNLYMWAVPKEGELTEWVGRAHHVLQGHRSIVNQVRYNHSRGIIASSGVEKVVKLWSILPLPDAEDIARSRKEEQERRGDRRVYSHEEYIGLVLRSGSMISHDYSSESTEENPRMMAFFDSLVQREIEGWDTSDGTEGAEDTESEEISDTVVEEEGGTASYTRRERGMQRMELSIADDLLSEEAESGIQSPSPLSSSTATSNNSSVTTSSSSSFNSSTSSNSSVTVGDSGLETSQGTTERLSLMQVLASPNLERIILQRPDQEHQEEDRPGVSQTSAETQTPPQSSQNLIADLIAKKRAHLVKRARRRASKSEADPKIVNKIIQSARRVIRSDSGSSTQSGTSEGTETDVTPVSSPVLDWASASSPVSDPAPSTSSPPRPSTSKSAVLESLKRKRIKLLTNQSDTESDNEDLSTRENTHVVDAANVQESTTSENASLFHQPPVSGPSDSPSVSSITEETEGSLSSHNIATCQTQFKKTEKKGGRNVRKRSLGDSDSDN